MNKVNITFKDKLGVFFWRNMMMPLIAKIGGKKYPDGIIVKEFSYGSLKNEKLDFIAPKKEIKKQVAIGLGVCVNLHLPKYNRID